MHARANLHKNGVLRHWVVLRCCLCIVLDMLCYALQWYGVSEMIVVRVHNCALHGVRKDGRAAGLVASVFVDSEVGRMSIVVMSVLVIVL